jgi:hypothetical protein
MLMALTWPYTEHHSSVLYKMWLSFGPYRENCFSAAKNGHCLWSIHLVMAGALLFVSGQCLAQGIHVTLHTINLCFLWDVPVTSVISFFCLSCGKVLIESPLQLLLLLHPYNCLPSVVPCKSVKSSRYNIFLITFCGPKLSIVVGT